MRVNAYYKLAKYRPRLKRVCKLTTVNNTLFVDNDQNYNKAGPHTGQKTGIQLVEVK
mgnify:CR=1 FL=1